MSKTMKAFVRTLKDEGYEVATGGSGHLLVRRDGRLLITMSASPKCDRLFKVQADLRRAERAA